MTEISKCPCCGGTANLAYYVNSDNEKYSCYVVCSECGLRTKTLARDVSWDAEDEVIKLFNARANTSNTDPSDPSGGGSDPNDPNTDPSDPSDP